MVAFPSPLEREGRRRYSHDGVRGGVGVEIVSRFPDSLFGVVLWTTMFLPATCSAATAAPGSIPIRRAAPNAGIIPTASARSAARNLRRKAKRTVRFLAYT